MTTESTRYFRIRGHVQGVGFRYTTQQKARSLGLTGWVRNCPDNTVESEATGDDEMLDDFARWLNHGPPGAHVEQVESSVRDRADASELACSSGFDILR